MDIVEGFEQHYDPSLDPEALLLSALMWGKPDEAWDHVFSYLTAQHFSKPCYGVVYEMIRHRWEDGHLVDAVHIRTALRDQGSVAHLPLALVNNLIVSLSTLGGEPALICTYAHEVATEQYRRQFRLMALQLQQIADEAPTKELFTRLVEHGREQRVLWNSYQQFLTR